MYMCVCFVCPCVLALFACLLACLFGCSFVRFLWIYENICICNRNYNHTCAHAYIRTCTSVCTFTYTPICTRMFVFLCAYVCLYVCMHACMCVFIFRMLVFTQSYSSLLFVFVCVCVCTCLCVRQCLSLRTCMFMSQISEGQGGASQPSTSGTRRTGCLRVTKEPD